MDPTLSQVRASVTIMGAVLFLVAAFLPISFRVFPQPSPVQKLENMNAYPGQWFAAQVLFAVGTVLTVVGIGLYAYDARKEPSAWLLWLGVALLTVGAMPWLWQVYARTSDRAGFAEGVFPRWPYLFYLFATEVGLAAFGVALLSSPLPGWVGWIVIVSMALLITLLSCSGTYPRSCSTS